MREILTGNCQIVRVVVIPGGEHDGGRAVRLIVMPPAYRDLESAVGERLARPLSDIHHVLSRADIQPVVFGHPAIIDEPVPPIRLLVTRNERHVADLDPLRRREERHAERIALNGGHNCPAVEQDAGNTGPLRRHADGEPARPGPNHQYVSLFHRASQKRER
jgi:hypothetical protein